MKNLFLTLTAVVSIFMAASAQAASYTSQTIGDFTYYNIDEELHEIILLNIGRHLNKVVIR